MLSHCLKFLALVVIVALTFVPEQETLSQSPPDRGPAPGPDVPNGVQVQERGPVHEAFAAPTAEPKPAPLIDKKPPANIDEMPPEEKPEGNSAWISGYWHWDDDRNDYLWVSGCWRVKPPGKDWVPGYWRESEDKWQWVAGFWANTPSAPAQGGVQGGAPPQGQVTQTTAAQATTYYPAPPAPPAVAAPPPPSSADVFWVPGAWVWYDGRYVWRAGYYLPGRDGYIWVSAHYRWTPYGYVYIPGYWDLAVAGRGVLYAPVVVNVGVVGPRFVYTPAYAIADAIVLSALFIRPVYCHYYFGNYYGPRYVGFGFESCFVYGRRCYEPIVAYQVWTYRGNPGWLNAQINLTIAFNAGRARFPGREVILRPGREVIVARGQRVVAMSAAARMQARETARAMHTAAVEHRIQAERATPGHTLTQPRMAGGAPAANHPGIGHPTSTSAPTAAHTPSPQGGGYRPSPYGSAGKTQTGPAGAGAHPGVGPGNTPGHTPAANSKTPPRRQPPRKEHP